MMLAQGRFWRASLQKQSVVIQIQDASLPEAYDEVRDARFDVALSNWNRLVRNLNSDRKLLGGLLLDFAKDKDRVNLVVGHDRLLAEFRSVVLDATVTLVEEEILVLSVVQPSEEA